MSKLLFPKRKRTVVFHLLFWISMTIFSYIISLVQDYGAYLLDALAKYLIASFIFYTNSLFVFPLLFEKKKYILTGLAMLSVLCISYGIKVVLFYHVYLHFSFPYPPYTYLQAFIIHMWWWIQYTLFALGYWYTLQASEHEKQRIFFEGEKLKAEFAYLRAKIDPHFLYNVLNVFYAKALTVSEELAEKIVTLADIMRYSLTSESDGKINLQNEVEQIKNVIAINKMRFEQYINVEFFTEGDFSGIRIIPFILISLVENAFKHGEMLHEYNPLVIKLSYREDIHHLNMMVKNRKSPAPNWKSYGMGLDNIKNRLDVEYKDRYELNVKEDAEWFLVTLNIIILA